MIKVGDEGTPAVWNDPPLTGRLVAVLRRMLGEDRLAEAEATMGGEDFSQYGKAGVPTVIFWLGSVDPKRLARYEQLGQLPPTLHSPFYYPDYQETLVTGITAIVGATLELLPQGAGPSVPEPSRP